MINDNHEELARVRSMNSSSGKSLQSKTWKGLAGALEELESKANKNKESIHRTKKGHAILRDETAKFQVLMNFVQKDTSNQSPLDMVLQHLEQNVHIPKKAPNTHEKVKSKTNTKATAAPKRNKLHKK